MAETSVNKSRTRKSASAKSKEDAAIKTSPSTTPKRREKTSLPLDTMICCVSGVASGRLTCESKLMKGRFYDWENFGDELYLDLAELQAIRNTYPAFFEQNWILIDDKEALDFLHVSQYYKYIYSVEDFEKVFTYTPAQIKNIVPKLSDGLKQSLAYVAIQRARTGELDSNAKIRALESATGFTIHGA